MYPGIENVFILSELLDVDEFSTSVENLSSRMQQEAVSVFCDIMEDIVRHSQPEIYSCKERNVNLLKFLKTQKSCELLVKSGSIEIVLERNDTVAGISVKEVRSTPKN